MRFALLRRAFTEKAAEFQNGFNFRETFGFGRYERQAPNWIEKIHEAHCGFYRNGTGLDEIYVHQRKISAVKFSRGVEISFVAEFCETRHFRGNFV